MLCNRLLTEIIQAAKQHIRAGCSSERPVLFYSYLSRNQSSGQKHVQARDNHTILAFKNQHLIDNFNPGRFFYLKNCANDYFCNTFFSLGIFFLTI